MCGGEGEKVSCMKLLLEASAWLMPHVEPVRIGSQVDARVANADLIDGLAHPSITSRWEEGHEQRVFPSIQDFAGRC